MPRVEKGRKISGKSDKPAGNVYATMYVGYATNR
jgi:hypothetical protein